VVHLDPRLWRAQLPLLLLDDLSGESERKETVSDGVALIILNGDFWTHLAEQSADLRLRPVGCREHFGGVLEPRRKKSCCVSEARAGKVE
jgi:hypothetical protein